MSEHDLPEPRFWSPRRANGDLRWSWYVLEAALRCDRRFQLSVLQDLVPLDSKPALAIGSAFHYGMEAAWRSVREGQRDPYACLRHAKRAAQTYPWAGGFERAEARRLLEAYWWGTAAGHGGPRDLAEWEVLGVEETVGGRIGPEQVPWEARLDLRVQVHEPAPRVFHGIWAVNWKTAHRVEEGTFGNASRTGQFLAEAVACRAAGLGVRGLILAIITKERTPTVFRDYVTWQDHQIAEAESDIAHRVVGLQARVESGEKRWPVNLHGCTDRYGRCPYWDYCEDPALAQPLYGPRPQAQALQALLTEPEEEYSFPEGYRWDA